MQLRRGGKTIARKSLSLKGGATAKVTLHLNKRTRTYLSKHARVKVAAVTVARDAAGNSVRKRVKVTLRAPRR